MGSFADAATFARKGLASSVGRNVISLYILQFGNYVLPLATVPYLVRVQALENAREANLRNYLRTRGPTLRATAVQLERTRLTWLHFWLGVRARE